MQGDTLDPGREKTKTRSRERHAERHAHHWKERDKHQSTNAGNHANPRKCRDKHQGRKFPASCPADSVSHSTASNCCWAKTGFCLKQPDLKPSDSEAGPLECRTLVKGEILSKEISPF